MRRVLTRMLLVLTVALLMAAMTAITVSAAFADIRCSKDRGISTCQHGNAGKVESQHHGAPNSNGSDV